MKRNLILDTDSYKASHHLQYPPNTTGMYSYLESRGGRYGSTVFFGLQYLLKEYLSQPVTAEDVLEAASFFEAHGEPFPMDGWMRIVKKHGGYLPISIRAVAEGSVVQNHNILLSVESTDPECFWVVSWMETQLVRLWYPITVATQSHYIKRNILHFLQETAADPKAEIPFKLHDFGSRGVSSRESAGVGGMAHLVNFMGSDTVEGVRFANHYYNHPMAAFSIPAAEHSTITSWGKENEVNAYRNMVKQFAKPGKLVAVVSDSYDLYNAIENFWAGELKQEVIDSGATVVIRPDSGNPPDVVVQCLKTLERSVGMTKNVMGYKVLPSYFRLIQGDGVNEDSIDIILRRMKQEGYSASNIAFGMGGALLQQLNRDTQRFAFKCSEITVNGESRDVFKDPVTDPGKRSKAGRLDLSKNSYGEYITVPGKLSAHQSQLKEVFRDGKILVETTLEEVRKRADRGLAL